jgi:hypothetical protein
MYLSLLASLRSGVLSQDDRVIDLLLRSDEALLQASNKLDDVNRFTQHPSITKARLDARDGEPQSKMSALGAPHHAMGYSITTGAVVSFMYQAIS